MKNAKIINPIIDSPYPVKLLNLYNITKFATRTHAPYTLWPAIQNPISFPSDCTPPG